VNNSIPGHDLKEWREGRYGADHDWDSVRANDEDTREFEPISRELLESTNGDEQRRIRNTPFTNKPRRVEGQGL
jgi:hypothetical protein